MSDERREAEIRVYFLGLDLGTRRDHSAIAVVTGVDEADGPFDHVLWRQPVVRRMHVVHLERLPLGMRYRDIAERVRDLVQMPALAGNCTVVADATGVGLPVVEMLRESELGAPLVPVVITGGESGRWSDGCRHVPRVELLSRLVAALEQGRLVIASGARDRAALVEELTAMRAGTGRESGRGHDDLVFALALGCWMAGRTPVGHVGSGRLV